VLFRNENESVPEVAFAESGQTLIEVTQRRFVRFRDVATGRTRILVRCHGGYCSALTRDARFLATADNDAVVRVWDLVAMNGDKSN
jgi:WD40 repeat protein